MSSNKIDLVLFGARGDLSRRKLFPALFQLDKADLLTPNTRIAAIARQELKSTEFIEQIGEVLKTNLGEDWCETVWSRFKKRIKYIRIEFSEKEQFNALKEWSDESRTLIFYMATPPSMFGTICQHLNQANCIDAKSRIVLEKPIGHDLESSKEVNDTVGKFFPESGIYRIDHYLGKETVQNLLALRFANRIIHTQWDNSSIDHIQITAAETVGIEGRWTYYDGVGQLRDMVQNHLLQLLSLVAMEPPNKVEADEIRAEKVKLLKAMTPINKTNVFDQAVRGQYSSGSLFDEPVVGYMEEEGAAENSSNTETFVALKVFVDNWRWAGVPFYLRTGKRMKEKVTQIVITYKDNPHAIFSDDDSKANANNRLVIRLQPNEGIQLEMLSKKQCMKERSSLEKRTLNLDFLDSKEDGRIVDAYERLLLEVLNGDQWLFVSRDEIEASWQWCDNLLQAWSDKEADVKYYNAGSWGPGKSESLIENDGRSWYLA